MARIWALVGAVAAVATLLTLMVGFVGSDALLTMSVPIGAGVAAAYLAGDAFLSRGLWLFAGVIISALGFGIGALAYPDTNVGLWLGAVVPVVIIGLATFATRRPSNFVAALLGSGALGGVYAVTFDTDPQSINVSLPIAIGQTVLPLGLGYLGGMLVRTFMPDDAQAPPPAPADDGGDTSDAGPESAADTTDQLQGVR
jgi:hypothetical protein